MEELEQINKREIALAKKRAYNQPYMQRSNVRELITKVVYCEKCGCKTTYFNKSHHQATQKCKRATERIKSEIKNE